MSVTAPNPHQREVMNSRAKKESEEKKGKWERKGNPLFSPTKGRLHVNTSMKLGSQYGWGL
jgi:hypothetical protein